MERYRFIVKQIGATYLIKIVDFFLMFGLFILLGRLLTPAEFGIYSIFSVTILLVTGLLDFGISSYIIQTLTGEDFKKKNEKFGQLFSFCLLSASIIILIICTATSIILKNMGHEDLISIFIIVIATSFLTTISILIEIYFITEKKIITAKLIELIRNSSWIFPLLLVITLTKLEIKHIFFTKFIVTLIVLIFSIIYIRRLKIILIKKIDFHLIKKALIYSLPMATLVISQWVINATDKYLLGIMRSTTETGNYAYIYSLISLIYLMSVAIIDIVIYPHATEEYNKKNKEKSDLLLNSLLKYSLIIIIPAIVGFWALGKEIITMISGLKYLSAIELIPFLGLYPIFGCLIITFQKPLLFLGKTKTIGIIYFIGMLTNIILNILLIPKFGTIGSAIAVTVSYMLIAILLRLKTINLLKIDYNYLKIEKIIISTLIMGIFLIFIHPTLIYYKIGALVLGIVIYFISLYFTKAYVKEEIDLIRSFVIRKKN